MTSTPSVQANPTSKRMNKMASNQATNMNHLLNFTLPPRQTRPMSSIPRRGRKTGTGQGVWNKERFVNAQYRFVMNPSGDYTVHFADPDIFFQWQDIMQVIVPRSTPLSKLAGGEHSDQGLTTCPICLSPPSAPRMTKCGHVFCFPCILHYLSTSENKWARCPICFDSVNEWQLKIVKWYDGPLSSTVESDQTSGEEESTPSFEAVPRAGSMLRLRLIQRPQITTLALPRSQTWPSDLLPPHQAPFHFLPDVFTFSKFMLATPSYLIADFNHELDQLADERRTLGGAEDSLGLYFVNRAEEKVRHQIELAAALETPSLSERMEKARKEYKDVQDRIAYHARRKQEEEANRGGEAPEELLALRGGNSVVSNGDYRPPSQARSNTPRYRSNINPPPPSTSTYYYYQAASGLPIYLHPLDIKILLSHFNNYSSFPDSITVPVEAFSEGSVNDDLRKRCKYLAHLPESADVIFVETSLQGVVGAEGLKNFGGHLKLRASRRRKKDKKDENAKARAEEREKERERQELSRFIPVSRPFSPPSAPTSVSSAFPRVSSPPPESAPPPSTSPPVASGAWGNRSFASALHSSNSSRTGGTPAQRRRELTEAELDVDEMWDELERWSAIPGGRKKRGARMVVLGGGGSGARRR